VTAPCLPCCPAHQLGRARHGIGHLPQRTPWSSPPPEIIDISAALYPGPSCLRRSADGTGRRLRRRPAQLRRYREAAWAAGGRVEQGVKAARGPASRCWSVRGCEVLILGIPACRAAQRDLPRPRCLPVHSPSALASCSSVPSRRSLLPSVAAHELPRPVIGLSAAEGSAGCEVDPGFCSLESWGATSAAVGDVELCRGRGVGGRGEAVCGCQPDAGVPGWVKLRLPTSSWL